MAETVQHLKDPGEQVGSKRKRAPTSGVCGIKRRRSRPDVLTHLRSGVSSDQDQSDPQHKAQRLARRIFNELSESTPGESIHLCGAAPLAILGERPDEVLALAHRKLHTWPYREVPICWRRLYEEATLYKAVSMLQKPGYSSIAAACGPASNQAKDQQDSWFNELIKVLDMGLSLSGGPGRGQLFEEVFKQLSHLSSRDTSDYYPESFAVNSPPSMATHYPITKSNTALSFLSFQHHIETTTTPLLVPGVLDEWPALTRWNQPSYLLHHTLGGRRLVPVEVGKSYVDDEWSQQIMPMRQFLESYLLASPPEVAYLAQHDLFAQIPALKNDIRIPDYCYTNPPEADEHAARTAGLSLATPLDEPLLNAWLGPAGTKTPLHTDPYHNILAQVVGYKYIRLYPPSETQRLYPRGMDSKGISLENTSSIDIRLVRPELRGLSGSDMPPEQEGERVEIDRPDLHARFPLFEQAQYQEAILKPGDSLYIPLGWWHYVESLTTSFSVSFWWN